MNWKHEKLAYPKTHVLLFRFCTGFWDFLMGRLWRGPVLLLLGIYSPFLSYNNLSYSERGVLASPQTWIFKEGPWHCHLTTTREAFAWKCGRTGAKRNWKTERDWLDFLKITFGKLSDIICKAEWNTKLIIQGFCSSPNMGEHTLKSSYFTLLFSRETFCFAKSVVTFKSYKGYICMYIK